MRRISPREFRRLTQRIGLNIEELKGVQEVIIRLVDKELVFSDAKVQVIDAKGEKIYQIFGNPVERELKEEEEVEIKDEDIRLVMDQTGASREEALEALKETGGDLAQAIILIRARKGS
ncbi:MAG: nascent polypeptide-associated complex protein [Thermoprotei archaeon]|nr:MAG: nascent polypeptide-associated complex protein [Thermoprotei archaeon]